MFPETVGSTGPNQPSSLIGDDDVCDFQGYLFHTWPFVPVYRNAVEKRPLYCPNGSGYGRDVWLHVVRFLMSIHADLLKRHSNANACIQTFVEIFASQKESTCSMIYSYILNS